MVGKCCQKILILGVRFSENILPSGDFLSRLMGEYKISISRKACCGREQTEQEAASGRTWDQGHSPRRDIKLAFAAVARSLAYLTTHTPSDIYPRNNHQEDGQQSSPP